MKIDYKNVRIIVLVLWGLGILMYLASLFFITPPYTVATILWVLGAAMWIATPVLMIKFWRCPHCGSMFPPRSWRFQYCPYCGQRLE